MGSGETLLGIDMQTLFDDRRLAHGVRLRPSKQIRRTIEPTDHAVSERRGPGRNLKLGLY
jgi:hypothetical protein